jgi:hypothetical protein
MPRGDAIEMFTLALSLVIVLLLALLLSRIVLDGLVLSLLYFYLHSCAYFCLCSYIHLLFHPSFPPIPTYSCFTLAFTLTLSLTLDLISL